MNTYKQALFAAFLLAAGLHAYAQPSREVFSANIVGIQKMPVEQNLQVISNPFEMMLLGDLVGRDGVFTTGTNPDNADNVLLYDSINQSYLIYYLRSAGGVGPEWRRGTSWATDVYATPSEGLFYRSRSGTIRTNVIVGDVVLAQAVTNAIRPGLNLLSNPYSAPVRLTDLNLKNGLFTTGTNIENADNVMIYEKSTDSYLIYYLRSAGGVGPEWRRGTLWATDVVIQPLQGFWFRNRTANTYNWIEETPYPDL